MGKKTRNRERAVPSLRLARHLRQLGMADSQAYQGWCADHGFGPGLNKPKGMLAREREFYASLIRDRKAAIFRAGNHSLRKCLVGIADGSRSASDSRVRCVRDFSSLAKRLLVQKGRGSDRSSLVRLIKHLLESRAKFVDESNCETSVSNGGISMLESLVLIATERSHWIRPLERWAPKTRNARRQFRSLLRHLFDQHGEVPLFMDEAWSIGSHADGSIDRDGARYRSWYLQIGMGKGLKRIDFPIPITKRMSGQFILAPKDVPIRHAVRWGQVLGLGGKERLANAVLGSRLGENFEDNDFWESVIRWLTEQSLLDEIHVGPIIDYLHNRRFVPEHRFAEGAPLGPPEPTLSMRGRTAESLLRQVTRWHQRLAGSNEVQVRNWNPCGISGFKFPEGLESSHNFRIWTIRELLGTAALVVEGRKLHHCVATYASSCASGATSIWTLESESYSGVSKLITLEVNPRTRTINQARGRQNRKMKEQEISVVTRWCAEAGLKLARHVGV